MKRFVGKDTRYIDIDGDAPVNAFDLPDGRRAFQYLWDGGTCVVPHTTRTRGRVQLVGNTAYHTKQKLLPGDCVLENPGRVITYIAEWNGAKTGWFVVAISNPTRAVC